MKYSDGMATARTSIATETKAAVLQRRLPELTDLFDGTHRVVTAVVQRPCLRQVHVP